MEFISITLDPGDEPQRIFESLNSTGLALEEGDKIRNFVLMGLSQEEQKRYYESYWTKIEKCTNNNVSGFVRDYLSIKLQKVPTINKVYLTFKSYAQAEETSGQSLEKLLADMLCYARIYEKFLTCKSGLNNQKLDYCLYRMKHLDITVTHPFLMEVLHMNQDDRIPVDEVLQIFLVIENYLFRRNICEVPASSLNKIFVNLNREILQYDNSTDHYKDKLIYTLLSKKESGRFPDDEEFTQDLSNKQVYRMSGKFKAYLFERFENYDTVETKDVYTHLDNNEYSIEHIMPQQLTPAWVEELGPDAEKIHDKWLHRLANLTLTGYNPKLSNKTFLEKRDNEVGGYKVSGLRMNQKISMKESWGEPELEERNEEMISKAKEIWRLPRTEYRPSSREYDTCSLDEEDIDLTGRKIVKYSYQNAEQLVSSWKDMFEHIVKFLHQKDRSVLTEIAYGKDNSSDLGSYFNCRKTAFPNSIKIDDQIYLNTGTTIPQKISILRKLFILYDKDPGDLVFYMHDPAEPEPEKLDSRMKYWTYALPIIRKENKNSGYFKNLKPYAQNIMKSPVGISGYRIACAVNDKETRVDFYLDNKTAAKNKAEFDMLYTHKQEIEDAVGSPLIWNRMNGYKAARLGCRLENVSVYNEDDWPNMVAFQVEWIDKICRAVLPYLREQNVID